MRYGFQIVILMCALLATPALARAGDQMLPDRLLPDLQDVYWMNDGTKIFSFLLPDEDSEQEQTPAEKPQALSKEVFGPADQRPMIALVIDDMGLDHKHSQEAVDTLPPAVTFAYLPYAPKIRLQTAVAKEKGHQLLVHLPMQPMRRTADPGPNYLGVQFPPEELQGRVVKNLSAFEGYDGVNNHMGSRFTQDRAGLQVVMDELKKRGVFFLDSRTSAGSVAEKMARASGLPTSHRDVFLDDEETDSFTEEALLDVERVARRKGSVIAIGHPKAITLHALQAWLPTLAAKGFRLAPLGQVIRFREEGRGLPQTIAASSPPPVKESVKENVASLHMPPAGPAQKSTGICEMPQ